MLSHLIHSLAVITSLRSLSFEHKLVLTRHKWRVKTKNRQKIVIYGEFTGKTGRLRRLPIINRLVNRDIQNLAIYAKMCRVCNAVQCSKAGEKVSKTIWLRSIRRGCANLVTRSSKWKDVAFESWMRVRLPLWLIIVFCCV